MHLLLIVILGVSFCSVHYNTREPQDTPRLVLRKWTGCSKYATMNLLQLLEAKVFDVPSDWLHDPNLTSRIKTACEKEGARYYRLMMADWPYNKVRSVNKLGAKHGFVYLTNDRRYICVVHPPENVQKIRVSPNMKNVVMRTILTCMKKYTDEGDISVRPLDIIHICRELGYDYPEFKVIEKSIKEHQ